MNSSEDPYADPYEESSSFAEENKTSIVVLGLIILLVVGSLITWLFLKPADPIKNDIDQKSRQEALMGPPQQEEQPEGSDGDGVYGFFYEMFSGAEDGLDENPHNLNNVEQLDALNIEGGVEAGLIDKNIVEKPSDVEANGKKKTKNNSSQSAQNKQEAQKNTQQNSQPSQSETTAQDTADNQNNIQSAEGKTIEETTDTSSMLNKVVYDSDGNSIGTIDTVIKENNNVEDIHFTLDPELSKEGASKFSLPYKDLNIVKTQQGFAVQLSQKQTEAMAEQYFKTGQSSTSDQNSNSEQSVKQK